MWILGIFLFSISTLVLSIDGSIAEEGLNALALAGGWNVSAAIFCDDKPHERRGACEQKFLKRKTPRPVANEDSELAKSVLSAAISAQWNNRLLGNSGPNAERRERSSIMSALFRPIALLKLLHCRSSFESSIFNDYIENGVKFESLDLPRKEEESVGFIAIQFIKNLQHGCNGIKPDVVKKCLEDGMPKPVEYEHKGLARKLSEYSPDIRELFKKTLDEWETCTECDSDGCIFRPNCAVYAVAFELLLGERDPKYEKMIDDREGL